MAPTAVDGKILIGTNGGEYGIRGFVKAYDANDGKLLWTFDTIPENSVGVWATKDATGRDMHRDIAAEKAAARQERRSLQDAGRRRVAESGGRSRHQAHLFRGRQSLARPRRRAAPGRQPLHRLAGLGRPRYRQDTRATSSTSRTTCGISTPSSPTVLVNVQDKNGKTIPGVLHAGKTGHIYVHDRKDCSLIRFSEAMVPQEDMWVLPTATLDQAARMLPGANGGVEWSPIAINPGLSLAYAINLTSR